MPRPTETMILDCVRSTDCFASRKSSCGCRRIWSAERLTDKVLTSALPASISSPRNAPAWKEISIGALS